MTERRRPCLLLGRLALLGWGAACRRDDAPREVPSASVWSTSSQAPEQRPGMVYIPAGTLLMGTPKQAVPRIPDVELAAEPVEVGPFFIDQFLHPNEAGAMPTTNVAQADAEKICAASGKRLCSEVELERACKGDANQAYGTGARYEEPACGTGRTGDSLSPNGFHGLCVSPFGVNDLHGSAWSWTSSDFGRGTTGLITIKGGNSPHGDVVARCANAEAQKPTRALNKIGFRCCSGASNDKTVTLEVTRGVPLRYRPTDREHALRFEAAIHALSAIQAGGLPAAVDEPTREKDGPRPAGFVVERVWVWHPLGNEELWFGGGCSPPEGESKRCGAFVGRFTDDASRVDLLFFASSERWQPVLTEAHDARGVYVEGGDAMGAFRNKISWDWGRVTLGPRERKKGKSRWVLE